MLHVDQQATSSLMFEELRGHWTSEPCSSPSQCIPRTSSALSTGPPALTSEAFSRLVRQGVDAGKKAAVVADGVEGCGLLLRLADSDLAGAPFGELASRLAPVVTVPCV